MGLTLGKSPSGPATSREAKEKTFRSPVARAERQSHAEPQIRVGALRCSLCPGDGGLFHAEFFGSLFLREAGFTASATSIVVQLIFRDDWPF